VIWYAKYNGTWQIPIKLTTSTAPDMYANYLHAPSIAVDSNNYLHVVWEGVYDRNLRVNQIWYMNYTTSWSTPIKISYVPLMSSSDQEFPSIATDSNNRIHVLWMSTREHVLYYSRYDPSSSWSTPVQIEGFNSSCPHLRWSTFPSSNAAISRLDYVFFRGLRMMFNSLSTSELPPPPSFSISIVPVSEFISVGQSLKFTSNVVAGASPYSYQWCLNGSLVSGATSSSWIFKPTTTGSYIVYVTVTDSDNNTVQSETAQATATLQYLKGSFGYSRSSGEAQDVEPYNAFGSRFTLNVEANFTSMSALMETWTGPEYPANYSYRFAIYNDNNNAIGSLVAQTVQGTKARSSNRFSLSDMLSFPSPILLTPGAYWLMGVADAPPRAMIYDVQTNDYNESVSCDIGGMTFPTSLPSAEPRLGHLYCIYASWEVNNPETVSPGENLFAITSNSTVSSLVYNSTTNELSFTVSGASGTTGYADIFISKTLLQDLNRLTVSVDGKPMNFTGSSADDFWVLHFVYYHSTHNFMINMQSNELLPEISAQITAAFLAASLTAVLCLCLLIKKYRTKKSNA
jgi:hypothetical protein